MVAACFDAVIKFQHPNTNASFWMLELYNGIQTCCYHFEFGDFFSIYLLLFKLYVLFTFVLQKRYLFVFIEN